MRKVIAAAFGAAFFLLAATPAAGDETGGSSAGAAAVRVSSARAGAAATTHRAGDLIVYRFACHDGPAMVEIARTGGSAVVAAGLMAAGRCFDNRAGAIAARLEAWIAGPFTAQGATSPASVWRVVDQFGDTEFVWIGDAGGRHAPSAGASETPGGVSAAEEARSI